MPESAFTPELGHAHLFVRDLERSIDFYTDLIGLALTEKVGDSLAFLSSSAMHHTLALQALGEAARPPGPGSLGLYHVAFELPSAAALETALSRLDERDLSWRAVDHGISWAVYFDDPDGNGLELYVDRRRHPEGRGEWRGVSARLPRERIRQQAVRDRA